MKTLIILLLAVPVMASGPKYVGPKTDTDIYQEFQNVYHDISNPAINVGTASTMTVTNLSFTHISSGPVTNWTAYTPTFSAGWGTVTNKNFFYRRMGDSIEVHGTFTDGIAAASSGTISFPSGSVIDPTKVTGSSTTILGMGVDLEAGGGVFGGAPTHAFILFWSGGASEATLCTTPTGNAFAASNVNGLFANSVGGTVDFKAPITGWSW